MIVFLTCVTVLCGFAALVTFIAEFIEAGWELERDEEPWS